MVKTLVAAAALLVATSAGAQAWNVSYDTGSGILTFGATGTLQADGNTIFVSSITNPAFDGTPGPALPFIYSASTRLMLGNFPATLSLDGVENDLDACTTNTCAEGFVFIPDTFLGVQAFASSPSYGDFSDLFFQANWSMTAAQPPSAIPEPASWAMLIAGFGLVGAMARRRRVGTVAA